MNDLIKTSGQLNEAIATTYIYGVILAVAFVLIMILAANMISWQPGKFDTSGSKRRVAFFVVLALALICPIIVDYFLFYGKITVANFRNTYMMHMGISAAITAVLYFLIGFILIRLQKNDTKLASIFPKKK